MAEPSASESSAGTDSDQDFDPSADMMVNDFDDEHTLDEEEALGEEDSKEEIDELTKDANMPLEELLRMYGGYNQDKSLIEENEEKTSDSSASNSNQSTSQQSTSQKPSNLSSSVANRSSLANYANSEFSGSESDEEYSANEDEWRRTIQVGSDYQAVVPEGLSHYNDDKNEEKFIETRRDQNRDILVWKPVDTISNEILDGYIKMYEGVYEEEQAMPLGEHSKDDDHALYLLFKCGYSISAAMERHANFPNPPADSTPIRKMMPPWTEEECRNFEQGMRTNWKDFFFIKNNKIPSRSVGEVVTFYYFWKKTERHDTFMTHQKSLEKKKYALHPGTTDYMDRFLDEQENMSMYQIQPSNMTSSHNPTTSLLHSGNQNHNYNHHHHHNHMNLSSSSSSRQSTSTLNSVQSRHHSNHYSHHNHQNDSYFAGNNSGSSGSVSISGNNMRTINVNASGEPQTIMINDGDFNGTNQNNKPIVVCTGGSSSSGSSKSSNYYRHSPHHQSSHRHSSHHQNLSSNDSTTTIVVGNKPVVIEGAWVSASGSGSGPSANSPTSLSTPSVSIYKISNNSGFNR